MHNVYEAILAKFGSRFCLNLRPNNRELYISPFGKELDVPSQLAIGMKFGEVSRVLPFTDQFEAFENIDQTHNVTSVSFSCSSPKIPVNAEFIFHSPFYPNNVKLCVAPFFYLDLIVTNSSPNQVDFELFVGCSKLSQQKVEALRLEDYIGFETNATYQLRDYSAYSMPRHGNNFSNRAFSAKLAIAALDKSKGPGNFEFSKIKIKAAEDLHHIISSHSLQAGEKITIHLLLAAFTAQDVLEVNKKRYKFKYVDFFSNLLEVIRYADLERFSIDVRNLIFNSTLSSPAFSNSLKNLIGYAFQSFSANSWWLVNQEEQDWFSLWDGASRSHSPTHLERYAFLFYLLYWPDLARMILDEWASLQIEKSIQGEMGSLLEIGESEPEPQEPRPEFQVEPSCDFISMLYLYWSYTADLEMVKKHFSPIKAWVNQIIDSDTDKDGFPDANSSCYCYVDQISRSGLVKAQTHLALRTLVALNLAKEMAEILGETQTSQLCEEKEASIRTTLEKKAWQKDHFAASILESEVGARPASSLQYKLSEAYSPYNFNSLIYPLLCGKTVKIDDKKMYEDLIESYYQTMKNYGCTSSSATQVCLISENLIRDIVAGYLGLDLTHNCENYWDYQLYINTKRGGGYTDLYNYEAESSDLNYDPRGIVALGMIYALGGIQIDKRKRMLRFHPLKTPLKIPILSLANWERGMIPWVEFRREGENIKTIISNEKCLDGFYIVETRNSHQ